ELRKDRMDVIRTRDEERGRHEDPEENHESPASPPTERRGPRPAHGSTCSPREYYLRESLVFIVPGSTGSCPRVSALREFSSSPEVFISGSGSDARGPRIPPTARSTDCRF